MNLHVYGCSYSIGSSFKHPKLWDYTKNWIDIVAKELKVKNVENHSQFGVSNEFIFKKVIENSITWKDGDFVLIQLTSVVRKWFFPDDPALSNITNMRTGVYTDGQEKAIKNYITHLQNSQLDDIIYTAYVYSLLYVKATKPNINILVIPGFSDFPGVNGNLTDNVCDAEFDCVDTLHKFYGKHHWDPRLNHMTYENHKVLANKVVDYFVNQTELDLTSGFSKSIYTESNI
jgi:hypothetical protein